MELDVELFDTTLRDGTQGGELNLFPEQKKELAEILHRFAPDMIIEASYAASDADPGQIYDFIRNGSTTLADVITTFGSTHKPNSSAGNCPNVKKMLESRAKIATVFGKTWLSHVEGLGFTPRDYLKNIGDTVHHLLSNGVKRVIYDAEHFFWGLKDNPEFAKETLKAAIRAGADTAVFCDTKGGMLPYGIIRTMNSLGPMMKEHEDTRWGIHTHNDTGCAVANANTYLDVMRDMDIGRLQVQGTINGYGERCGNSDLTTIIGNMIDKQGISLNLDTRQLTRFAHEVARIGGAPLDPKAPYVGPYAFGHKGGIHIYSQKRKMEYVHTDPEKWGNKETYLITSMSGLEMYADLANHYGYMVDKGDPRLKQLHEKITALEKSGFKIHYLPAEHLLLVHSIFAGDDFQFDLDEWETKSELVRIGDLDRRRSQTVLTEKEFEDYLIRPAEVVSKSEMGPVDSQFKAVRKWIEKTYSKVGKINLIDFNVDITRYARDMGSESAVIAYITYKDNGHLWTTQSVSDNILEATLNAIVKGFRYHVLINEVEQYREAVNRPNQG